MAANEGEADAQFEQKLSEMLQQAALQVALASFFVERQKIEIVRILGDFLREVGLGRREREIEIRDGFPLSFAKIGVDLVDQNRPPRLESSF